MPHRQVFACVAQSVSGKSFVRAIGCLRVSRANLFCLMTRPQVPLLLFAAALFCSSSSSLLPPRPVIRSFPDRAALSRALADAVYREVRAWSVTQLKEEHPRPFLVALSGGSLPSLLVEGLKKHPQQAGMELHEWTIFLADERVVPEGDPRSNLEAIHAKLFDEDMLAYTEKHGGPPMVFGIEGGMLRDMGAGEVAKTGDGMEAYNLSTPEGMEAYSASSSGTGSGGAGLMTPKEIASNYQDLLTSVAEHDDPSTPPVFDLVLLGMGEDGHTASLFPGHPLLEETTRWVAEIENSPKLPPKRVTLTFPVLNAARAVFFVTAGAGKADSLGKVAASYAVGGYTNDTAARRGLLPAAQVRPAAGKLEWFVDDAASAQVPAGAKEEPAWAFVKEYGPIETVRGMVHPRDEL